MTNKKDTVKEKKLWSPLEDAKWFMDKVKEEVDNCDATSMAARAAGAQGMLEAAFYTKEITEDVMVIMKDDLAKLIAQFNTKCKCQRK